MIKFFLFIKKIHFVLIFIILEAFAIHYYANSTSYTKAKLITASNYVVGGIYSQISGLNSYLHLKKENAALTARVALLENELDGLRRDGSDRPYCRTRCFSPKILSPADGSSLTSRLGSSTTRSSGRRTTSR